MTQLWDAAYLVRVPNIPQDLVPTAEVARTLNIDVRTVHRMVRLGRLTPAIKAPGLRGAMLFYPADVAALAAARTAGVAS